jgi:dTDP-4-dehydrorhamnose reductase
LSPLELWGGVECTVNRLGDIYHDQLHLTGHHQREDDVDRLAALGLQTLRYPLLWERVAPERPDALDWRWNDRRFDRLRQLGIRPIAGLVHHGSGPRYTSLTEDSFAPGLANFAAQAARRYPWLDDWTPVNEPLTTARFSCLYGHWYPHAHDEALLWRALLNEVDATRLAMRAIRQVTPGARLIQTEDLGRTFATAALADQAAFDNARRWLTWDLLVGKVVPGHDLWSYLCDRGFEQRLRTIAEDPCPPDVIGINHYLTSDRFLDHRLQRYPSRTHGGNGCQGYADVEAVRVLEPPPPGIAGVIEEAWERYRRPLALTEVHNGCSREEQLRWLAQAWSAAQAARRRGVGIVAVTPWALFGSQGWDTLLTGGGRYETGAFDVRSDPPRPTALASLIGTLASGGEALPLARTPGWWNRNIRLQYAAARTPARIEPTRPRAADDGSEILVTGGSGTLGQAMAAACRHRGIPYRLTYRRDLDLLDDASVDAALDRFTPWAVIDCCGWVRVDEAEDQPAACLAINAEGAARLAGACAARAIASVTFSSDLVFAGRECRPYVERDRPAPRNVYGHSKARMEQAIAALSGSHLVVRTAAFFSPFDEHNFAVHAARALLRGERFRAAKDFVITPTYVPDLCDAVLDLLIDGEAGLWHLSHPEALTWAAFAQRVAHALGLDPALVDAVPGAELGWHASRPRAAPLASARGPLLPPLDSAIERFATVAANWRHR